MLASCRESHNVAPQTLSPAPERSQVTPDCARSSCETLQRSFIRDGCRALVFTADGVDDCSSKPPAVRLLGVRITPALLIRTLLSHCHAFTNARTDAKSARSRRRTSQLPQLPVGR